MQQLATQTPDTAPRWLTATRRATPAVALAFLGLAFLLFAGSYWAPRLLFVAVGCGALATVLAPLAVSRDLDDFISPWMVIVVTVALGMTARGAYVSFGRLSDVDAQYLYMLDRPVEYFLLPSALVLGSLAVISAAYMAASRGGSPPRLLLQFRPSPAAIPVVAGVFAFIGFVAFLVFVQQTGGFNDLLISTKRGTPTGLEVPDHAQGFGHLRFLGTLSAVGFFGLTAHWTMNRYRMLPWRLPVLAALFGNAALFPFYSSSRSNTMWLVLILVAVLYYAGYRLALRHMIIGLLVVLTVFYSMTILRPARNHEIDYSQMIAAASPMGLVDEIVANRNLIDVFKTSHVVQNVGLGEELDYKRGSSIYGWLLAAVPREIWSGKPRMTIGPELGILVYGNYRAGVPPGFIGEMWWNFHLPGVLLGSVLVGLALRRLHERFSPRDSRDLALILVYSVGFLRFGMLLIGTALGQAVFNAAVDVGTVLAFMWLSDQRRLWAS